MNHLQSRPLLFLLISAVVLVFTSACQHGERIDYSSQIKPILNKRCIACHGGVAKQGGFSLLFEEQAKAKLPSGKYGIVPGNASKSEMIQRLTHEDLELRMPFEEEMLPQEEIELLTKWVNQGAEWGEHWAYVSVQEPEVDPQLSNSAQIDAFIDERLTPLELTRSDRADPETIVRRLSLDIIGMPSYESFVNDYLNDPSDENYEIMVDSLLASPHYGEKWTSMWMDLARYADTKGYEKDNNRNIWRYRDWVIRAFNDDMPYDQFITEQIAGDLLENPTEDQLLATAFHRNTMTNDEGGTDNEEYRVAAVIDRVNTTWETIMGTSFACVQCHGHPYDPFKHEDYYSFMAFFNNTRDSDTEPDYPVLRHFDEDQAKQLESIVTQLEDVSPQSAQEIEDFLKYRYPVFYGIHADELENAALGDTKWLSFRINGSARLAGVVLDGQGQLYYKYRGATPGGKIKVRLDTKEGKVIGEMSFDEEIKPWHKWNHGVVDLEVFEGEHDIYLTYENPEITNQDKSGINFDYFHFIKKVPDDLTDDVLELADAPVDQTPIMMENPSFISRKTFVFDRGVWTSPTEEVTPETPGSLFALDKEMNDRLDLAEWMTNPDHPLTSRTIVNRMWAHLFGNGISETLEDIGTQGLEPTHQELLDYLSWQLMHEYDWSLKKLIKNMVMSETYRQASDVTEEHLEKDPLNTYYARMNRTRLTAEQVRDQALAASKSLTPDLYGEPVMPYQPEGVWAAPYDGNKWEMSEGKDLYRRALYTFWKRTSPYPALITFDAEGREVCNSRRINTNTPLQALATMNDQTFIDLSKKMVDHVWEKDTEKEMIATAYKSLTFKDIEEETYTVFKDLYDDMYEEYSSKRDLALEIAPRNTDDPASYAAMTVVANAMYNLDEVLTKA